MGDTFHNNSTKHNYTSFKYNVILYLIIKVSELAPLNSMVCGARKVKGGIL